MKIWVRSERRMEEVCKKKIWKKREEEEGTLKAFQKTKAVVEGEMEVEL